MHNSATGDDKPFWHFLTDTFGVQARKGTLCEVRKCFQNHSKFEKVKKKFKRNRILLLIWRKKGGLHCTDLGKSFCTELQNYAGRINLSF